MPTTTRQSFDQTTRPIFKTYPNIVLLFCIAFGRLRPQCNPAAKKMVQIRVYISPLLTRFLLKITQMCCSYFGPFLSLLFCTICGRLRPQCNPTQKKMVQIRVYIMPFFKAFFIKYCTNILSSFWTIFVIVVLYSFWPLAATVQPNPEKNGSNTRLYYAVF